ncbi:DNA replication and repair protein RecO [Lachnospiraceae bacterium RM5]|nr:DNA replication and repair protein RecO [Lachnospiraceae bacterium RM5]
MDVVYTGMVIKTTNVGEFDKRLVVLTKEAGKIVVFARGARRPKSSLLSATMLFAYGEFELFAGKDAYQLKKVVIKEFFENITKDIESVCYASFFCEFADYFCKPGQNSRNILKLLGYSLKALENEKIDNRLVKCIFEMKMLYFSGEYPEVFSCVKCQKKEISYFSVLGYGMLCDDCKNEYSDSFKINPVTVYTLQYIISSKLKDLYKFNLRKDILDELVFLMKRYMSFHVNHNFKSLDTLSELVLK